MQYIVLDLEWNNTYSKKLKHPINEIIEIGAVRLNERLEQTDCFHVVLCAQLSKKLRSSVVELTNITPEELAQGMEFSKAASAFRKWVGSEPHVLLSWGDGDIRVLLDNYRYFNRLDTLPFIQRYADLQLAVQSRLHLENNNQISLLGAAERLGIAPEQYAAHRALDDSRLSAECLRRVFDETLLAPYIHVCNASFYARLRFKVHVLSDINNPKVDKREFHYECIFCGAADTVQRSNWKYSNQYFRAEYDCPRCGKTARAGVRFKVFYDRIDVRRIASELLPPEEDETAALQSVAL